MYANVYGSKFHGYSNFKKDGMWSRVDSGTRQQKLN